MAARPANQNRENRNRRPLRTEPSLDSSAVSSSGSDFSRTMTSQIPGSGSDHRDRKDWDLKNWDQKERDNRDWEDGFREDGPVVFICGSCRAALGDSESWDGSDDQQNQIRLKKVTSNVVAGTKTRLHGAKKQSACLVVDLQCGSCGSLVGMIYTSTPKSLDHQRLTFCLDVDHIDSYVVGSADQSPPAGGTSSSDLVSLALRGRMEQQLEEMKVLVVSMAQRMEDMEAVLETRRDETEQ